MIYQGCGSSIWSSGYWRGWTWNQKSGSYVQRGKVQSWNLGGHTRCNTKIRYVGLYRFRVSFSCISCDTRHHNRHIEQLAEPRYTLFGKYRMGILGFWIFWKGLGWFLYKSKWGQRRRYDWVLELLIFVCKCRGHFLLLRREMWGWRVGGCNIWSIWSQKGFHEGKGGCRQFWGSEILDCRDFVVVERWHLKKSIKPGWASA